MADKKLELDAVRAILRRSAPTGFRGGENLQREPEAKVGKVPPSPRVTSAMVGKGRGSIARVSSAQAGKQQV